MDPLVGSPKWTTIGATTIGATETGSTLEEPERQVPGLVLAWKPRGLVADDRRGEIEMQQLAVKFLRNSVEHSTVLNLDNLPVVTYLVGELYRRLEAASERHLDQYLTLADGSCPTLDPSYAERFPQDDPLAAMQL